MAPPRSVPVAGGGGGVVRPVVPTARTVVKMTVQRGTLGLEEAEGVEDAVVEGQAGRRIRRKSKSEWSLRLSQAWGSWS